MTSGVKPIPLLVSLLYTTVTANSVREGNARKSVGYLVFMVIAMRGLPAIFLIG